MYKPPGATAHAPDCILAAVAATDIQHCIAAAQIAAAATTAATTAATFNRH
jgi:hypothetical protein